MTDVFFRLKNNRRCRCMLEELTAAAATSRPGKMASCGALGRICSITGSRLSALFAGACDNPAAQLLLELKSNHSAGLDGYGVVAASSRREAGKFCHWLSSDDLVRFAHLGASKELADTRRDPLRDQQWALSAIRLDDIPPLRKPQAVTIAVIDTGVDRKHPDLLDVPLEELVYNGRTKRDRDGHGTHVTGTIAAVIDNGEGISGICQPQRFLSMKALSPYSERGYYRALRDAIHRSADVLNLSLTGESTPTEASLIRTALRRQIVVVAAMGNHGQRRRCFPAAYRGVIAVGASTPSDQPWSRANRGPHIDLVAPGVQMLGTVPRYSTPRSGSTYYDDNWHGTSLAAALVSGTAALCRALNPRAGPREIRDALRAGADFIDGQSGFTHRSGWGRLNVAATLEALVQSA